MSELLADMESSTGPIPAPLLEEARDLWRVRPLADPELERDQLLCLRVAELLADRRGIDLVGVISIPELEDRTNPAVELVVGSTGGRIALEHTTIETFSGQIQAAVYLRKLIPVDPFEVPGLESDSQYTLGLVPSSLEGNAKDTVTVVEALRGWITEAAAALPPEPCLPRDRYIRAPVGRLPIPASLLRSPASEGSPFAGKVMVSFEAPADRETLREARILEALNRKLPKLNAARGPNGLSVLVVETGDLSLANQWLISEALQRAAASCEHELADYVVLVITVGESLAWVLHEQGTWSDERFTKLDLSV